jgi:hypothetical protein
MEQQFAQLALQQNMMHKNMHQIIVQVIVLSFYQSNAGCGCVGRYGGCSHGRERSNWRNRGQAPALYKGGQFGTHGGFSPGLPQGVGPHGGMPYAGNPPNLLLQSPPAASL